MSNICEAFKVYLQALQWSQVQIRRDYKLLFGLRAIIGLGRSSGCAVPAVCTGATDLFIPMRVVRDKQVVVSAFVSTSDRNLRFLVDSA